MQRSLLVFGESLQTDATRKAYLYQLEQFRKWAMIRDYDSLLQGPPKAIQELLQDYIIHLKNKVKPNSIPIYFAPIELFYVMNDVVINYKKLRKLFPKKTKKGNQRGYTKTEVMKILDNAKSKRNHALVLLFASSGVRLGAIPGICLKHLSKIDQNSYAIKIYEDELEEDHIFTTPEATKSIDEYLEERQKDGEFLNQESPLIRTYYKLGIEKSKACTVDTLAHVMGRLVSVIDRKKKGNRFDVPKDHGFRKLYATIIKDVEGITPTMSEKLINHIGIVQLDGAYYRPTKLKMFEAYKKAIPELTISKVNDEKEEADLKHFEEENPKLTKKINKIMDGAFLDFRQQLKEAVREATGLTKEEYNDLEEEKKQILKRIEERETSQPKSKLWE